MDDDIKDEAPKRVRVEEPRRVGKLVYSGPADEFVFEGLRFPRGIPVEATAGLAERLLGHELAAEGHLLTVTE